MGVWIVYSNWLYACFMPISEQNASNSMAPDHIIQGVYYCIILKHYPPYEGWMTDHQRVSHVIYNSACDTALEIRVCISQFYCTRVLNTSRITIFWDIITIFLVFHYNAGSHSCGTACLDMHLCHQPTSHILGQRAQAYGIPRGIYAK